MSATGSLAVDDDEKVIAFSACEYDEGEILDMVQDIDTDTRTAGHCILDMSMNNWTGRGMAKMVGKVKSICRLEKVLAGGNEFTGDGLKDLVAAVDATGITHLSLANAVVPKQFPPLFASIFRIKNMKSVTFSGIPGSGVVFRMVKTASSITSLHMSSVSLSNTELAFLSSAIQTSLLSLSVLSIGDNNLHQDDLLEFFTKTGPSLSKTLTHLDISRQIVAIPLLHAISSLESLTSIDLSRCCPKENTEWAKAASAACKTLQKVNASKNMMKEEQINAFCEDLVQIENLNLNYNKMSENPKGFLRLVSTSEHLTVLSLTGAKIPEKFLDNLAEAVKGKNISRLYISRNHWKETTSSDPIGKLCKVLENTPSLKVLYIEEISCVKPSVVTPLGQALRKCEELYNLSIAGNFMRSGMVVQLLNAVEGHPSLKILNIRPTPLQHSGEVEFTPDAARELLSHSVVRQLTALKMENVKLRIGTLLKVTEMLVQRPELKIYLNATLAGHRVKILNKADRDRITKNPFHFFPFLDNKYASCTDLNFANMDLSQPDLCEIVAEFIVKHHRYAHSINLSDCKITPEGLLHFSHVLKSPDLGMIDLSGNPLDEGCTLLQTLLESGLSLYEVRSPFKYNGETITLKGKNIKKFCKVKFPAEGFDPELLGDDEDEGMLTLGSFETGMTSSVSVTISMTMEGTGSPSHIPKHSSQIDLPTVVSLTVGEADIHLDTSAPNLLGQGSYGRVFKAMCLNTSVVVAVKALPAPENQPLLEEVLKESNLMSSLCHPYVVGFYGCVKEAGHVLIVMEHMDSSLSMQVPKTFGAERSVPDTLIARWGRQVLGGLQYLHSQNVIHSDIKPSNILFDGKDGCCKISDFGCSRKIDDLSTGIQGTPAYMSPESLGKIGLTKGMDVWAFGCTMLELHARRMAWSELGFKDNFRALLHHIVVSEATPARPPTLSGSLAEVLDACLQRDYAKRLTTSQVLALKMFSE